jgi:hypothetical protein
VSNPWPHRSRHFDPERCQYVSRPGEDVAEDVAVTWSAALAEAGHSLDEIDNCAARVRDGARAASKRLRRERDAARQCFAEERETALEIRAERDSYRYRLAISPGGDDAIDGLSDAVSQLREAESRLTAERDAARLELRALEWMTFESPRQSFSFGFEERASGRIVWVSRAGIWPTWEFDTYASAARALGWEG